MEEQKQLAEKEAKKEQQNRVQVELMTSIKQKLEPAIIEANEIAQNLGRDVVFKLQYAGNIKDNQFYGEKIDISEIIQSKKGKIEIKVEDFDHSQVYLWTPEKFRERLIIMKDLFARYGELGIIPNIDEIQNPFNDTPEPMFIGEAYYSLRGLSNLIDNPATVNLIGSTFEAEGNLELNIVPVNHDGSEDLDFYPEEPSDLID